MEQKSEKPTAKKKKDSAKKGQMFLSQDLNTVVLLLVMAFLLNSVFSFGSLFDYFEIFANRGFDIPLAIYAKDIAISMFMLSVKITLLSVSCGVFATLLQTRFQLATEAIRFDLNTLSPVSGFKEIFSMRSLKNSLKSILYLMMAVCGCIFFVWHSFPRFFIFPFHNLHTLSYTLKDMVVGLLFYMLLPMLLIVMIDYLAEFFLYIKDIMMSKEEVKQEYKNSEGSPEIRSKRKEVHKELLSEQVKSDVKGSNFILANPTHIAIGIYFNPKVTYVPYVSVVEKNARAKAVIAFARKEGIPVVQNIPLARRLIKEVKRYRPLPVSDMENIFRIIVWLEQVEQSSVPEPQVDTELQMDTAGDVTDTDEIKSQ